MTPRFKLEGVGLCYSKKRVLGPVSLTLNAGQCVGIVGASGSGKTTLLNLLGLLWDRSFDGRIEYYPPEEKKDPLDYTSLGSGDRAMRRSRDFGFVLQNSYLLPHLTGRANVGLPLALQGRLSPTKCEEAADRMLQDADVDPLNPLKEAAGRSAGAASGGQQQRMAVLRAIIHEPSVLFADEPLSNLDPFSANAILKLIGVWFDKNPAERTLLFVTHDLARLRQWGRVSHYLPLRHGQIVGGRLLPANDVTDDQLLSFIDPGGNCTP